MILSHRLPHTDLYSAGGLVWDLPAVFFLALDRTARAAGDRKWHRGKTSILVAHRFASAKNFNRILVVDGGHIEQDENYEQRTAHPGPFKDLVQVQILKT